MRNKSDYPRALNGTKQNFGTRCTLVSNDNGLQLIRKGLNIPLFIAFCAASLAVGAALQRYAPSPSIVVIYCLLMSPIVIAGKIVVARERRDATRWPVIFVVDRKLRRVQIEDSLTIAFENIVSLHVHFGVARWGSRFNFEYTTFNQLILRTVDGEIVVAANLFCRGGLRKVAAKLSTAAECPSVLEGSPVRRIPSELVVEHARKHVDQDGR